MEVETVGGTVLTNPAADGALLVDAWRSGNPSPVPVLVSSQVWDTLCEAASSLGPPDPPTVYRLFMVRGKARHVVAASRIRDTWQAPYGVTRWQEGGYPSRFERLRKGGNAFVRTDAELRLSDVWWMAREQTDLRIIFAPSASRVMKVSAWWVRGSDAQRVRGSAQGRYDTQGTPLPVHLLIDEE